MGLSRCGDVSRYSLGMLVAEAAMASEDGRERWPLLRTLASSATLLLGTLASSATVSLDGLALSVILTLRRQGKCES